MFCGIHHSGVWLLRAPAVLATLLVATAGAETGKAVPGLEARVQFGFGHDSNSYREAVTVDPGYFLPYDIRAEYVPPLSKSSRLQLTAAADGQLYLGSVTDGGEQDIDLGIDYSRRLVGGERGRASTPSLDAAVHGGFAVNRRTYISRLAGEEYSVDFNGIPVPLGDRFNSNDLAGGVDLSLRCPKRTQWSAAFDVRHRNYVEDYEALPDVDRLDNRRTEASFRMTQRVGGPVRLRAEYAYEVTDYYDRAVRDLDGDRVEGVAQTFFFNTLRGGVRFELGQFWRIELESAWRERQDPYQGYYDAAEWSVGPEVRVAATPRLGLRADYEYAHRNYERAHVNFDPARPLRRDHDHHLILEGTYKLNPRSSCFILVEHDNVDEANPAYTYDRTRGAVGYELRY